MRSGDVRSKIYAVSAQWLGSGDADTVPGLSAEPNMSFLYHRWIIAAVVINILEHS